MINEQTVAAVVRTLATKHGPRVRDIKWIAGFAGVKDSEAQLTLKWLQHRKFVRVDRAQGGWKLTPSAKKIAQQLVKEKSTNFIGFLDQGFSADSTEEKSSNPLARRLYRAYQEHIGARSMWKLWRDGIPPWKIQPVTTKLAFAKAAETCGDADPGEFINAQFAYFDRLAVKLRRPIFPTPSQLHGPSAAAHYAEYLETKDETKARQAPRASKKRSFEVEDERLSALSLFHGASSEKVLRAVPQEFSKAYLRHKGVWEKVKDRYEAAADE